MTLPARPMMQMRPCDNVTQCDTVPFFFDSRCLSSPARPMQPQPPMQARKFGAVRACKDAIGCIGSMVCCLVSCCLMLPVRCTGVDLPSLRGTWTSDADDTDANETGDAQVASKSSNSKM